MTQTLSPLLNFPVWTDTARVSVVTEPEASLQVVKPTFPRQGEALAKLETTIRPELRAALSPPLITSLWCTTTRTLKRPQQYWRSSINGSCHAGVSRPVVGNRAQVNIHADDNQSGVATSMLWISAISRSVEFLQVFQFVVDTELR
jgi:hypothetical protein